MIGAIIGDIIGSVYEWNNIKTKDFKLFSPGCFFTDDTVIAARVSLSPPREIAFLIASSKSRLSRKAIIASGTVF